MGLGGPFLFISSMQLSNAFPKNSGQVLSVLTGSFDASSCVFLLYRLTYQHGWKVSPHVFFLAYLFWPVFSILVQLFFMPKDSYKSEFEVLAEAQAAAAHHEPQETTALLESSYLQEAIEHYHATGEVEYDVPEAFGSARRASVFAIPKDRRVSWDATDHHPKVKNPVTGVMHGKNSLEQIQSPYWVYASVSAKLMQFDGLVRDVDDGAN